MGSFLILKVQMCDKQRLSLTIKSIEFSKAKEGAIINPVDNELREKEVRNYEVHNI